MVFHWIYTYAMDTLAVGMTPPPADYQWLQYVPYLIIVAVVVVIWGPKTLTRQQGRAGQSENGGPDG